ncbi:MAG: hypothetical protein ACLR6I_12520 [Waltera sp.]
MKKRVLSMLLAFILCFSTLPMRQHSHRRLMRWQNRKNSRKQTLRQSKRKQKQLRHRGRDSG